MLIRGLSDIRIQAKSETPTLCPLPKKQPFTSMLCNLYAPDSILVSHQCDKTEVSAWKDCIAPFIIRQGWMVKIPAAGLMGASG